MSNEQDQQNLSQSPIEDQSKVEVSQPDPVDNQNIKNNDQIDDQQVIDNTNNLDDQTNTQQVDNPSQNAKTDQQPKQETDLEKQQEPSDQTNTKQNKNQQGKSIVVDDQAMKNSENSTVITQVEPLVTKLNNQQVDEVPVVQSAIVQEGTEKKQQDNIDQPKDMEDSVAITDQKNKEKQKKQQQQRQKQQQESQLQQQNNNNKSEVPLKEEKQPNEIPQQQINPAEEPKPVEQEVIQIQIPNEEGAIIDPNENSKAANNNNNPTTEEPKKMDRKLLSKLIAEILKPRAQRTTNEELQRSASFTGDRAGISPQKLRRVDSVNDKFRRKAAVPKQKLIQELTEFKENNYRKKVVKQVASKSVVVNINPVKQPKHTTPEKTNKPKAQSTQSKTPQNQVENKLRKESVKSDSKGEKKKHKPVQIKSPELVIVHTTIDRKVKIKNDLHSRMMIDKDQSRQKAAIELTRKMNQLRNESEIKRMKKLENIEQRLQGQIEKYKKATKSTEHQMFTQKRKKALEQITEQEKRRFDSIMKQQLSSKFIKELKLRQAEFGHYSLRQIQQPMQMITELGENINNQILFVDQTNRKLNENQFLLLEEQKKNRRILKEKQKKYSRKVNNEHLPKINHKKQLEEVDRLVQQEDFLPMVRNKQKKAWQIEQEIQKQNQMISYDYGLE